MRKILLLIIFIILLVAVSWFKPVRCQTLNKEDLLKQYQQLESGAQKTDTFYTTPEIFGDTPGSKTPVLIAESTTSQQQALDPFGYDLFRTPSELSVPSDVVDLSGYILGPGDDLIVYLWGKVEKVYNLTVDRQGKIFIPRIGEMVVWGMPLEDFESKIVKMLSGSYTDFSISVSLGKIRSIRIYLTGEVKKPGAYTVSSLTTLFNALYMAGGPNLRGSIRDIQLIRKNRVEKRVDLYQFLLKGDSQSDVRLSSGDVIFIPVSGPRASIAGEVKRAAIYELTGEEKLSDLMDLAGGPTALAYLDRIMLDRISPDDQREVMDLNMNPEVGEIDDVTLKDGDIFTVFSLFEMRRNTVAIAGMVKHPGYYERTDSTTLRSIILQSVLQPENVYYERINLFRRHTDQRAEIIPVNLTDILNGKVDILLQDQDSLHIYSVLEVERRNYVYIDGEVKNPGKYNYYENMTMNDLIFLCGNLNENAHRLEAELARSDSLGNVKIIFCDLTDENGACTILQENDRVFIRRIPNWLRNQLVYVEGAVRFPGTYALLSNKESLYDIINRTGGFREDAFPKGTIFRRNSITADLQRQNLPAIIANSQLIKEDSLGNIRKVELLKFDSENLNRIIIDIEKIMNTRGREGDINLDAGDYVYVPHIPSGISVMGAVGSNGTIRFEVDKNVKYYIMKAGNFTQQSDKKHTRLIKADGRVFAGRGTQGKKVELGDAIVVPSRIKKDRDWLKTISSTASILGGLATTVFIIDKL